METIQGKLKKEPWQFKEPMTRSKIQKMEEQTSSRLR